MACVQLTAVGSGFAKDCRIVSGPSVLAAKLPDYKGYFDDSKHRGSGALGNAGPFPKHDTDRVKSRLSLCPSALLIGNQTLLTPPVLLVYVAGDKGPGSPTCTELCFLVTSTKSHNDKALRNTIPISVLISCPNG